MFEAFIEWERITLPRFVSLCKVEVPEKLVTLWKAEHESEDWKLAIEAINDTDISDSFHEYYKDVIKCLTDITPAIIEFIGQEQVNKIYYELLHPIALSTILNTPFQKVNGTLEVYTPSNAKSFDVEGSTFYYPDSVNIAGADIPLGNEPIISFIEAADIAKAWKIMAEKGFQNIALLAGIYCRKKGEAYDQTKAIERAKMFENLTMDIYWRVFFCTQKRMKKLQNDIQLYTVRSETKKKRNRHWPQSLIHSVDGD